MQLSLQVSRKSPYDIARRTDGKLAALGQAMPWVMEINLNTPYEHLSLAEKISITKLRIAAGAAIRVSYEGLLKVFPPTVLAGLAIEYLMGSVPSPELTAYIANHLNLDTQLRELEQQLALKQQSFALEQQQQHYYFSLKVIVALGVSLAATIIGALMLASIIIPPVAATAIGVALLAGGVAGITAAGFFAKSSYDNSIAIENDPRLSDRI